MTPGRCREGGFIAWLLIVLWSSRALRRRDNPTLGAVRANALLDFGAGPVSQPPQRAGQAFRRIGRPHDRAINKLPHGIAAASSTGAASLELHIERRPFA